MIDWNFADWMLNDAEWGVAQFARPEWLDAVADAAAAVAAEDAPALAGMLPALSTADSIYDICGSESAEIAIADAASAIAKYVASDRMEEATQAHAWGWRMAGRDPVAIAAAQAAAMEG